MIRLVREDNSGYEPAEQAHPPPPSLPHGHTHDVIEAPHLTPSTWQVARRATLGHLADNSRPKPRGALVVSAEGDMIAMDVVQHLRRLAWEVVQVSTCHLLLLWCRPAVVVSPAPLLLWCRSTCHPVLLLWWQADDRMIVITVTYCNLP